MWFRDLICPSIKLAFHGKCQTSSVNMCFATELGRSTRHTSFFGRHVWIRFLLSFWQAWKAAFLPNPGSRLPCWTSHIFTHPCLHTKPYTPFGLQSCVIIDPARTRTYSGAGSLFHFSHRPIMKYNREQDTPIWTIMSVSTSQQRLKEEKIAN